MKTLLICPTFLFLFFMTSCSSTKTSTETINDITKKVESKDFTIVVNSLNPMKGRQIFLSSDCELQIKNDSAFAYLPYFGEAYVAPISGEDGIKFAEQMTNYSISNNKKSNGWNIHFVLKSRENGYEIYMDIFNNGSASFTVNSINKDAITYNGEVKK